MSNEATHGSTARVWFITGASRGLGLEIAGGAIERGDKVVATARRPSDLTAALPDDPKALLVLPLDVRDPGQAEGAVAEALARFGRIDVLVNNAGQGVLGAVEEVSEEQTRAAFDVNVFGLLSVTRAVLPTLRRQRSGLIVNLSSVAGVVGLGGWGIYCATKFAVEGLTESMRQELAPFGIRVIAVEPGGLRTDFLDPTSLQSAPSSLDDYGESLGETRAWAAEMNHAQPGDPVKAATAICDLPDHGDDLPERLQLGRDSFEAVAEKSERTATEQERWRAVSMSTELGGTPARRPPRSA